QLLPEQKKGRFARSSPSSIGCRPRAILESRRTRPDFSIAQLPKIFLSPRTIRLPQRQNRVLKCVNLCLYRGRRIGKALGQSCRLIGRPLRASGSRSGLKSRGELRSSLSPKPRGFFENSTSTAGRRGEFCFRRCGKQ